MRPFLLVLIALLNTLTHNMQIGAGVTNNATNSYIVLRIILICLGIASISFAGYIIYSITLFKSFRFSMLHKLHSAGHLLFWGVMLIVVGIFWSFFQ